MQVYITTQGAEVVKEARRLKVMVGRDTAGTLFLDRLEQLIVCGNVEFSHRALAELFKRNIDTVFLSKSGRYYGRLAHAEGKNVFLRRKQFSLLDDQQFQLNVARSIVVGKMTNQATLLKRIERSKNIEILKQTAEDLRRMASDAAVATSLESLLGFEGKGSALFFSGFRWGFIEDQSFRKRVRRPPTDPVNSVLSFLYTLLMNRVYTAVRLAQLDPFPGNLHALDYGRYSLVLDLMEEFRPIIADTLCLSLFNLQILRRDDFIIEEPDSDEGPAGQELEAEVSAPLPDVTKDPWGWVAPLCSSDADTFDVPEQRMEEVVEVKPEQAAKRPVVLKEDALKRVLEAFERKLTTRFYHAPSDKEITYSDALFVQAVQYRQIVEGELKVYQPILLR